MKQFTNIFALVVLAVTLACIPSLTYAQVTVEWVQTFSNGNNRAMALDNAGNIYTTGLHYDGTIRRALLLKYDPTGALLWSQTLLIGSSDTYGYALAIDGNGDVIIAGRADVSQSVQGFIAKYNASGANLWSQTTAGRNYDIDVDASGNVYVMSVISLTNGSETPMIARHSASGVQQWAVNSPSNRTSNKIVVKGEYVYVTGQAYINLGKNPNGPITGVTSTVMYNAANGAQVWVANYPDPDGSYGVDLVVDGSGNVYATGLVWTKAGKQGKTTYRNPNWITLKYNASGVQQWVKTYDGNATEIRCDNLLSCNNLTPYDRPGCIALDNSGNIIVTGVSYTTSTVGGNQYTSLDMTVVKYNTAGTQQWASTYDGPQHTDDWVSSITTSASGSIYIAGVVDEGTNQIATSVKFNASGVQQWVAGYDLNVLGYRTLANSIKLDNTGNVYMAGSMSTTGDGKAFLIKYSQTGTPKSSAGDQRPVPDGATLDQNYPNPFNPSTTISYSLVEESPVVLKVSNVLGMEVATLVNEVRSAGTHTVVFHAEGLESGMYTYELTANGRKQSKRMMLLK